MAYFNVTYDLVKKTEHDYEPLWAELKRLGGVKYQDSAYLIDLSNSAKEVLDHIKAYMHGDDRLMVTEFTTKPDWTRAFTGTKDWINERFP